MSLIIAKAYMRESYTEQKIMYDTAMLLAQFLTVAAVHFLAVVSPGPDFAIVTKNSLLYSRKTGIYTSVGIALGIMIHVAYSLLGIGFLISQSIVLFSTMKYLGAAYLIYIGYKSLRAKPASENVGSDVLKSSSDISPRSALWSGFLTNALNPKASLFFLALFTQIIDVTTPKAIQFMFGIEMMIITFVWFAFLALVFSHAGMKKRISKVHHWVEKVTGVVLIALGIKVALSSQK